MPLTTIRNQLLCLILVALTGIEAHADCFDSAAAYQGLNATVLRAISLKENSRCDGTISRNRNGSVDVGCMQINSIHFKELSTYGVHPNDLQDQCKNIYIGAWHYKRMIRKYGDTWIAVGAYHSETPHLRDEYARGVYRIMLRFQQRVATLNHGAELAQQ
jgi:soluble lytic murein transglycosylase-like protein